MDFRVLSMLKNSLKFVDLLSVCFNGVLIDRQARAFEIDAMEKAIKNAG